jgi:REP-associated tyrosine transposase
MPRQPRLDIAGALHHVMLRGINRSSIFRDDRDRTAFLEQVGQILGEGQDRIFAWVLMRNHVHILFKSGKMGISTFMRKLLTWYALYFNRRHHRTGHLFENRYKSILCDEDKYLLALVRYIHLNPVRAKVIPTMEELDRYPWSGHGTIMGKAKYPWMDIDTVLSQFGNSSKQAKAEYRRFVREGMGQGRIPELTGGGLVRSQGGWSQVLSMRTKGHKEESDERILGSGDFVNDILREAEEREIRQLKLKRSGHSIEDIIEEECEKGEVSREELKRGNKRRQVCDARIAIARRSREELGLSGAEIARHLGVNTSSVNRALARTE